MEEQIYKGVWVRVFAQSWSWAAQQESEDENDVTPAHCEAFAGIAADLAAAAAVRKWDESKRLAAITTKNQENP